MSSIGNRSIIQGLCLCCLGTTVSAAAGSVTVVEAAGTKAAAAAAAAVHRNLADDNASSMFVNLFQPTTNVDATALIDKDVRTIYSRTILGTQEALNEAEDVFQNGAYAESYAHLTLLEDLATDIKRGTLVVGTTTAGSDETNGIVYEDATVGDTTLRVLYNSDHQCYVGGLSDPIRDHCFAKSTSDDAVDAKSIVVDGITSKYKYDPLKDTFNGQTLEKFGKQTVSGWTPTNSMYDIWFDYSQTYDYANSLILAAFSGTSTSFSDADINFHFGKFSIEGRSAAIRWGIIGLHVWTKVLTTLQHSIAECYNGANGRDAASFYWDQAVAVYTGSIPKGVNNKEGYLLYTLADTECQKFGTCVSNDGDKSHVNKEVFDMFNEGKSYIETNQCSKANSIGIQIRSQMIIPLIQGLLRKAYAIDVHDDYQEITQGEASGFAASILPHVYACDKSAAILIHKDFAPGNGEQASYEVLKFNLERAYACLGVTCSEIGGLIDNDSQTGREYLQGAEPCDYNVVDDQSPTNPTASSDFVVRKEDDGDNMTGLAVGLGIGIVVFVVVVVFTAEQFRRRRQLQNQLDATKDIVKDVDLELREEGEAGTGASTDNEVGGGDQLAVEDLNEIPESFEAGELA